MKILQVNKLYPPHLGGIENVVREVAENLAESGWQSDVLVCRERGSRSVEKDKGVKIYRAASLGRLFSLPISWDFFRLFKKVVKGHDILLIHHPFPLASLARFLYGTKTSLLAVWYHSDIVRQRVLYWLVYPFLYFDLKSARVIFVSSHRLAENSPLLSKFLDKCQVIPFGIDPVYYQDDYHDQVSDLHRRYGRFMLAVGRLVYYKGYPILLEALKTAPGKLLIIGSGPLETRLRRMIKINNLTERVIIISNRPDNLVPYYQACEFLVFPSQARTEAFGLVQIEAMACGKPVINTNLPTGVPEVSLNGETGLTVPIKDNVRLAEAIKSLWEDEDLRLKLGAAARKKVSLEFSKDKFKADLASALLRVK